MNKNNILWSIKNRIQSSKLLEKSVSSIIGVLTIFVALSILSITGYNPVNLTQRRAQAALVCPSGYVSTPAGCQARSAKENTSIAGCPDGSVASGNQCQGSQNVVFNCNINKPGQVTVASGDWRSGDTLNMCTDSANASNFSVGSCDPKDELVIAVGSGYNTGNSGQSQRAEAWDKVMNYSGDTIDVYTNINGTNTLSQKTGRQVNDDLCAQPNYCPSNFRVMVIEAKARFSYNGSSQQNQIVCVNKALIADTNTDSPVFTVAGGREPDSFAESRQCGDDIDGGSGPDGVYAGTSTVFGDQQGNGHFEVSWICSKNNFTSPNTISTSGCPSAYPVDTNDGSATPCAISANSVDNTGATFQIEPTSTTANTGTCTPATIVQAGGTTSCSFPLTGAPTGIPYSLPATPITAKIGTTGASSNPCTISGNNLVCTGITASSAQTKGVNTVSLSMGNGTAPITLTAPLTPAEVPALAASCALATTNSTTTCTYTLPVGTTLPTGTQMSIGNGAAGGTCTATGQVVTCTGVPTGTAVGNQPINIVIGGVTTPTGETVGIATSPLTPAQVPALTVICNPATTYSTTDCNYTLPDGVSIPAGTTVTIGSNTNGGVCTSTGQVVTCTGVPTGITPGTLPINVVIGGVSTDSGETVVITPSPLTPDIINGLNPALVVTCETREANSTTTCKYTLPEGLILPVGTQIQVGSTAPGGTCTSTGQVVTCTGVPTGITPGTFPISIVIGGVPTLIVGSTVNVLVPDRQVKRIDLGNSSSNTNKDGTLKAGDTYTITLSNGQKVELQIIANSDGTICDSISAIAESKQNGKSYIEYRALCKQVTLKSTWLTLNSNDSYTFEKIKKSNGEVWTNFPASIGTENRNGKKVVTTIHSVTDNQNGDSEPKTTNIFDPYTLNFKETEQIPTTTTTNKTTAGTTTVRTGGNQLGSVAITLAIVAMLGLVLKVSRKGRIGLE